MGSAPEKFENVSAVCKANVYFDGKVVSHAVLFADGSRKTLGLIYPGSYTFDTKTPETMTITDGVCRVKVRGQSKFSAYASGSSFHVAANSAFEIAVDEGVVQYICGYE